MNKDRLWIFGLTAAILVVAGLGYVLGVSPILSNAAAADEQRASIASTNSASEARIAVLKKQFENIGSLQEELAGLTGSVPIDGDMPVFLAEINTLTTQNAVQLTNVNVSDATKYVPPVAAAVPASSDTATGTPTPTPSPSTTTGTTTPTPMPVVMGPAGRLVLIPVKISVKGNYGKVMAFVAAIQGGPRLFLSNTLDVAIDSTNATLFTADINGYVYALPLAPGAVSVAAAGSSTAAVSSTSVPSATPTPMPTP